MWWIAHKESKQLCDFAGKYGYPGTYYKVFKSCTFTSKCKRVCHQCGRCRTCHDCVSCGRCQKYIRPYKSRDRVISALQASRWLVKYGIPFSDLELVNANGRTMTEMVTLAPEPGRFALRHRTEKWYWSSRNHGRVWYRRPGDVSQAWRRDEDIWAQECGRKEMYSFTKQRLVVVECMPDGSVKELIHYVDVLDEPKPVVLVRTVKVCKPRA